MKIIPRKIHGVLDYLVGALLIAAPWVLGFADNGPATYLPVTLGSLTILYSLLTNYEMGVLRVIPFPAHLVMDFASGLLLASSPWIFGFEDRVWIPHLVVGLVEIGSSIMTRYSDPVLHARPRTA
ncbi:MAG: SPW repeat protein [Terrimicrobiaceae bacterium]|nr:SPW repeat protein [Terrimicrobiaceae bacterium]